MPLRSEFPSGLHITGSAWTFPNGKLILKSYGLLHECEAVMEYIVKYPLVNELGSTPYRRLECIISLTEIFIQPITVRGSVQHHARMSIYE